MALREAIDEALKNSQKARDAERVSALRLVRAAIQSNDIARRGEGKEAAGDADILQILAKMVKQREESAAAFEAGKRPELAAKERSEIEVIRAFMPRQMEDAEIVEVMGKDGNPPYRVRFHDGHESVMYPGPDSVVRPKSEPSARR